MVCLTINGYLQQIYQLSFCARRVSTGIIPLASNIICVASARSKDRYYPGYLDIRVSLRWNVIFRWTLSPCAIKGQGTTARLAQLLLETDINVVSNVSPRNVKHLRETENGEDFIYNAKLNCTRDDAPSPLYTSNYIFYYTTKLICGSLLSDAFYIKLYKN